MPQEWWALFRSPALNAMIERSLSNNPSLQSAMATLRSARQMAYAQEGKYFPLVSANFNPTYTRTPRLDHPGSQQQRQSFRPVYGAA